MAAAAAVEAVVAVAVTMAETDIHHSNVIVRMVHLRPSIFPAAPIMDTTIRTITKMVSTGSKMATEVY